ncbi:unnamed protein product [Pocillopora meandrina]|uniref:Death domain-containing protein n=1 Tax=Pocillopora meandrina TaxID=46732 RepID=A0AAU9VS77_9CNID|nr:unnamed protein product [Pocillopora meandrina]
MAEGGQGSGNIILSMGKIQKLAHGNVLLTNGSGWIVTFPQIQGEIWPDLSKTTTSDEHSDYQTVVATTSQVVSKSDLASDLPWTAEFLPQKRFNLGNEKFSLSLSTFHEVDLPGQKLSLMLFPIETLHKQKKFSRFLSNELQPNRSQLCYQEESKAALKVSANTMHELLCHVLVEDPTQKKPSLNSYVLSMDELGLFFLHPYGNKAKLKTLEDFQNTEKPMGSVIIKEDGRVVGFLAFGDKDEILPLFFPRYFQDDGALSQAGLTQESHPKEKKTVCEGDHNRNKNGGSLLLPFNQSIGNKNPDLYLPENEQIVGNEREPLEMSYPSLLGNSLYRTSHRSYSEHLELTPRTGRKLCKSISLPQKIPLKDDSKVSMLESHISLRGTLCQYLDTSIKAAKGWKYLAELNKVSTDQSLEHHSRSKEMFEVVASQNPSLLIGEVKRLLRELKIMEVWKCFEKLHDNMEIGNFLETQPPVFLNKVFLKLDHLPTDQWQTLGLNLGVERDNLRHIMTDCANQNQNPAQHVIGYIFRSHPTMLMGQFKKYLSDIKRNDVKARLDDMKDSSTIEDLHDDLDKMREITSMLNVPDNLTRKNYKDLADVCGVPSDLYQSLQPPCVASPTAVVLEEIVREKPHFTMYQLFLNLRDMKRLDVIQGISIFFVEEDFLNMKRKLKISDE